MRLIDADVLKDEILDWAVCLNKPHLLCKEDTICVINEAPTIDAVEVVHGRWDDSGRYQFPSGRKAIRCNICGCALSESEYRLFNWNYCPVCGAKMDGERKTE